MLEVKISQAFVAWLADQDRSEKTITGYLADLERFATWFTQTNGEGLTPERLTPTDVREFRAFLQRKDAKPATINRALAAIRAFGAWADESGVIQGNPAAKVKAVKKTELAPQWLDKNQVNALVRKAEELTQNAKTPPGIRQAVRDEAIIKILLNTGLRVSELCALRLGDVDMKTNKGVLVVRQGKGTKRREVPMNKETVQAIQAWRKVRPSEFGDLLFYGARGDALTASGIHRRLADIGSQAKVEAHPHTLRHTFAKSLVDAGVTLEKVGALLGHSSLNTTRVYVTPGERDLREAVERLDF